MPHRLSLFLWIAAILTLISSAGAQPYSRLQLKSSGHYLDAVNCGRALGLNPGSSYASGACQLWTLIPAGGGFFRLQLKSSGQYLDAVNCGKTLGLNPGSTYVGGACQLWKPVPTQGGYFRLQLKSSGQYLDAVNCGRTLGLNPGSSYASGACQLWRLVAGSPAPPAPPGGAWIMGYAVGYERDLLPLADLEWSALTHLVVGRITPNPDGSLNTTFDIDPLTGPVWAKAAVQQAHAHNVGALLMLGGAGAHAGFVGAMSAAHRASFVQNVLQAVQEYGFDGVDLDWEPLERADEAPLLALAQALRQARPGLLLSLPVNFVNTNFPGAEARPSLAALAPAFDRINIMSYSMAGADPGWTAWHSSALSGATPSAPTSVQSSVQAYLAAGIPAGKLGLGIGFYGLCYRDVSGPGQPPPMTIVSSDGDMSYLKIVGQYLSGGVKRWDATAQVPYLSSPSPLGPQGCTYVSYEDAASVALKGAYARAQGLGGVIIWTLGQGHFGARPAGARDPLLKATRAAFRP